MEKGKKVLTTGDVARICQVAPRTVSKWFDSGQLRGYRIPGSRDRRIPMEELSRFMKRHNMPMDGLWSSRARVLLVNIDVNWEPGLCEIGGYEVQVVSDFFQAGVALSRFSPHVVVLEVKNDCSEEMVLCDVIHRDEEFQGTRVVALTQSLSLKQKSKVMASGFDACLENCRDVTELVKCIEHVTSIYY